MYQIGGTIKDTLQEIQNRKYRGLVKTATIDTGVSTTVSSEVDLEGLKLAGIAFPATWTAANITFHVATASGGTFEALYDDAGALVTVTEPSGGGGGKATGIDLVAGALAPWRFVKLVSTNAQAASRALTLVLKG